MCFLPASRPLRCAVIGNPVAHSLSPQIHAAFAAEIGLELHYARLTATEASFARRVNDFFTGGGTGLNVTLPFKTLAFSLVAELPARLARTGAVNTLWYRDGSLHGENTDGIGLVRDLLHNLGWPLAGRRLLLLGAGGAARGVLEPLLAEGPAEVALANRTQAKAGALAATLPKATGARVRVLSQAELATAEPPDLIINTTSAGLQGGRPQLPASLVGPASHLYDLVYGAEPTGFQLWGRELGAAATADGLGMLVEQAAASFYIWHGRRVETAPVISRLRDRLRTLGTDP